MDLNVEEKRVKESFFHHFLDLKEFWVAALCPTGEVYRLHVNIPSRAKRGFPNAVLCLPVQPVILVHIRLALLWKLSFQNGTPTARLVDRDQGECEDNS